MKILISNDDGFLAPGLVALAEALCTIADITVVAPDSNRSGSSNALTLDRPLCVERADNGFYYINGTPADCIHIALTSLLSERPDLVVSGINQGQNMGDDILYSGTVAAATEAFLFGISGIAFSQLNKNWIELDSAARMARDIIKRKFETLVKPFLLNVNIPNLPYAQLKPCIATRLGKRHISEPVFKMRDPYGKDIFWLGLSGKAKDASEGTDFYATSRGHVSITPLQINLTHVVQLENLQKTLI